MSRLLLLVSLVLLPTSAWAGCVTIPLDDDKIPSAFRQAMAYEVAFAAGHDEVPTSPTGGSVTDSPDICFQTFDPTGIVTQWKMANRFWTEEAARQAQMAATTQAQTDLTTLLNGLATDQASWDGMTTAQKLAVTKKLLQIQVLRRTLGK